MDVKSVTCPVCGYVSNFYSDGCVKCGVIFAKYYEIQERRQREDKDRGTGSKKGREASAKPLPKNEAREEPKTEVKKPEAPAAPKDPPKPVAEEIEPMEAVPEAPGAEPLEAGAGGVEAIESMVEDFIEEMPEVKWERDDSVMFQPEALAADPPAKEAVGKKPAKKSRALKIKPTLKELLKKYDGDLIGINYAEPGEIKPAKLIKISEDHFSVYVTEGKIIHSFPYRGILAITERIEEPSGEGGGRPNFEIIVKVLHAAAF